MTRIDAHHHLWRLDRRDYAWLTKDQFPTLYRDFLPKDITTFLRQCDIAKTILVQGAETSSETEFLLGLAHESAFIAGVVGWTDLAATDAPEVIARLATDKKLVSLRPMLQSLAEDDWILRAELAPALRAIVSNGLRLDVLIYPRHLPFVAPLFARHPDLPMVIDHGAKPYIARGEIEPWKCQMQLIARDFPVFCKLSGLATEAAPGWTIDSLRPYVETLIEAFGPERLMWGSDWPMINLAGNYLDWFTVAHELTKHLSETERNEIFGGTATRFYGIDR